MQRKSQGFTLIELSIVLVIIGLIAGGILTGNLLIKGARIRATVTQIERYNAAANTFRLKYGYLPGDLPNAANGYGFVATNISNKGDDIIEDCAGYGVAFGCETDAFWTQLYTAGLIADTLTDTTGQAVGVDLTTPTGFLPPAKLGTNGTGYTNYIHIGVNSNLPGGVTINVGTIGVNYFRIASVTGGGTWGFNGEANMVRGTPGPGMTPVDASAIDSKMDDGVVNTGIVLGYEGDPNGYAAAYMYLNAAGSGKCQGATGGSYNFTNLNTVCALAIKSSF